MPEGRAVEMVPVDAVNEAGVTVAEAREHLAHDQGEVALDLFADLYKGWRRTTQWRDPRSRRQT
jgi:hypothetical protein